MSQARAVTTLDSSVNNLIPMVFQALDRGERPRIFGDDYPTPDGTCIRDFIHVADLAAARVAAAGPTEEGVRADAFNIGCDQGSSVREVMNTVSSVLGIDIEPEAVGRRVGDPPATFAQTDRIQRELGWRATRGLLEMVASAWSAWPANWRSDESSGVRAGSPVLSRSADDPSGECFAGEVRVYDQEGEVLCGDHGVTRADGPGRPSESNTFARAARTAFGARRRYSVARSGNRSGSINIIRCNPSNRVVTTISASRVPIWGSWSRGVGDGICVASDRFAELLRRRDGPVHGPP
jgi:hypothetical protein